MVDDERLGGSAREAVEDEALWIAPGVAGGYDWSSVGSVTAAGHGAGAVVNTLLKVFPELRARIAAQPSALRVVRERVLDADVLPGWTCSPAPDRCLPVTAPYCCAGCWSCCPARTPCWP